MVNWNDSKERKAYMKEWREKPENKLREKEYELKRKFNPLRIQYKKEYNQRSEVKKRHRESSKKSYQENPNVRKRMREQQKRYNHRPTVKKRVREQQKGYSQQNKKKIYAKRKINNQKPKVKKHRKEYMNNYQKQLRKTNPNFALTCKLRNSLMRAFKYYSKTGKIKISYEYEINYQAIIEYLKPFPKDIENYHVDHIIPLSLFDFNNPEHIKKAFLPENHQFLTIQQNLEKGNRLIMPN